MTKPKHIVVVAGEESGDIHAASFISELRIKHPLLRITGIGGDHMKEAGAELISDLAKYGVTGFSEVIRHFKTIKKAFKLIKTHLINEKPDLLVLVDYPGFNIRLAQFAKKLNIKVVYYISPQVWAWKAKRLITIKKNVDHMAVILPFEKKIYEAADIPVSFVGHPLVNTVKLNENTEEIRKKLNIPKNKKIIALLPGSRTHEIERHLPIMAAGMTLLSQQFPADLHVVIPVARTIKAELVESYLRHMPLSYTLTQNAMLETVSCSDAVVVASGTASLECALLCKPMCIVYKASLLTYIAAMKLIKVKYLGLCNLLQNTMIVPELLQYDFNARELSKMVAEFLSEKAAVTRMQNKLMQLRHSLSTLAADCSISQLIEREIFLIN
ncbi:lipid-A-disaccharide synthase (plasmid) [Legionella adelaidensis]|uniref:Lipid-A-disaccharide synthase n=1 Tax=Legionella adelaidensis TaxID=45056 RepID=A0A0W0R478_9GAMM|nr:lipid-A-disaccharide synthase [Legionella adelaidensis]KTC65842.1 lipid-A-disaccharide synthase [Legionella adelaidensis]VEH85272.1 lipid-A-disaccharide synthase [Legionella adelaidensis]